MLACRDHRQGKAAELLTIQTDLTTDSAADEITEAARAGFGRIDILANNAGIGQGSIRPDSWQRPPQILGDHADRPAHAASPQGVEFAPDSPLEGDGFEPSVPR